MARQLPDVQDLRVKLMLVVLAMMLIASMAVRVVRILF